MKKVFFLLAMVILSNVIIAADDNTPDNVFEWLDFIAALISFIVGWFVKTPQNIFGKKKG